ncbi:SCF ubiquitin ligase complex subunit, partial [Lunasporangiospora selenospora]
IKLSRFVLLTDESVLALTRFCPQLMEIDVTNCLLMSSYGIRTIFQNLPQIRDLNLSVFTNLTDLAFSCIPLGSSSTSSASSQSMTSSSSSLSLRSSSHSLQNSSPGRFEHLRILNLTSCTAITDDALLRILPAAPRLRNLTLTKCDRLTDVGVMAIKVLGKHLHYLHLGHCSRLTDRSITTLAQHCTRIRYLDLACCSRITDAAVFALAQLQKLRRIGLVKCSNITDHGIYAMLVSQVLPRTLERVHLSYCIHLSDTAVAALVSHCTKLTHLSVTGVPAFMNPRYQIFCRVAPTEFTPQQRDVFCVFSGKASSTSTSQVTGPVTPAATPNAVTEVHDGTTTADLGMSDDMDVDGEMEMDADVEMGAETEVTPGATSTAVDQAAGS